MNEGMQEYALGKESLLMPNNKTQNYEAIAKSNFINFFKLLHDKV